MGDQVVEVLRKFDLPSVEQGTAVPKISFDRVPQRSAIRRPQKAEQLVEVPTEPGYSLAVIDVRALGADGCNGTGGSAGGGGGLQGLRAGQGSTAADVEQIIDIPVPQGRRRRSGSPQGSLPRRGSTANVEQIVDVPARGGLQGFFPGQGSSSRRFLQDDDEGIHVVFRTFPPGEKKCGGTPQVECESARQSQLIQAGLSSSGSGQGV